MAGKQAQKFGSYLEVLGTGGDGTQPSFVLTIEKYGRYSNDINVVKRYLFNCGEATQRLCMEKNIKIAQITNIAITQVADRNLSGVPGIIMALSTSGAKDVEIIGPSGVAQYLNGMQNFVRRKYPQIQAVEVVSGDVATGSLKKGDINPLDTKEVKSSDSVSDPYVRMIPVHVNIHSSTSSSLKQTACRLCEMYNTETKTNKRLPCEDDHTLNPVTSYKRARVEIEDKIESEESAFREWLHIFYTNKNPRMIPNINMILKKYEGRFGDLKTALLEKYGEVTNVNERLFGHTSCSRRNDSKAIYHSDSSDSNNSVGSCRNCSDSSETETDTDCEEVKNRMTKAESLQEDTSSNFKQWLIDFYTQHDSSKLAHVETIFRKYQSREEELKEMLTKKYITEKSSSELDAKKLLAAKPQIMNDTSLTKSTFITPLTTSRNRSHIGSKNVVCYIVQLLHVPDSIIWVIDCPTIEYIDNVLDEFLSKFPVNCRKHSPSIVIHFSPTCVLIHPKYANWIASVSKDNDVEHLFFDGEVLRKYNMDVAFCSSFRQLRYLQNAEPTIFPGIIRSSSLGFEQNAIQQKFFLRVQQFAVGLAQGDLCYRFNGKFDSWKSGYEFSTRNPENQYQNSADRERRAIVRNAITSPRLAILGTGSAAPSKLRNSSGLYLQFYMPNPVTKEKGCGGILLDCGEGIYGQLLRHCDGEQGKLDQVIYDLRCVWISHNHADHHCGLLRIMIEYYHIIAKMNCSPLPGMALCIIAPRSVLRYAQSCLNSFFPDVEDKICYYFRFYSHDEWNSLSESSRRSHFQFSGGTADNMDGYEMMMDLVSVPVEHCRFAYGAVCQYLNKLNDTANEKSTFKLVYSGDTRPCQNLIDKGKDADLLIHEATFDDTMLEDAIRKKHCTIQEAISVGQKMAASSIILTHFSQRYPKVIPNSSSASTNVSIAFDSLIVDLNPEFLKKLPTFLPRLVKCLSSTE